MEIDRDFVREWFEPRDYAENVAIQEKNAGIHQRRRGAFRVVEEWIDFALKWIDEWIESLKLLILNVHMKRSDWRIF